MSLKKNQIVKTGITKNTTDIMLYYDPITYIAYEDPEKQHEADSREVIKYIKAGVEIRVINIDDPASIHEVNSYCFDPTYIILGVSRLITASDQRRFEMNGTFGSNDHPRHRVIILAGKGGSGGAQSFNGYSDSDVLFVDYTGDIVAGYSKEEVRENSFILPEPPYHDGLTFQGWNWSIEEIEQYADKWPVIGPFYTTESGFNEYTIDLTESSHDIEESGFKVVFGIRSVEKDVIIDWGDGSEKETIDTSIRRIEHVYVPSMKYTILTNAILFNEQLGNHVVTEIRTSDKASAKFPITPGVFNAFGFSNVEKISVAKESNYLKMGNVEQNSGYMTYPDNPIQTTWPNSDKMLGNGRLNFSYGKTRWICFPVLTSTQVVELKNNFHNCAVERLSFPILNTGTLDNSYAFKNCCNLRHIGFPDELSSSKISAAAQYKNFIDGCRNLEELIFSDNVSYISGTITSNDFCMGTSKISCGIPRRIVFGSRLSRIESFAPFNTDIEYVRFKNPSAPIVGASVFTTLPTKTMYYVPAGSLDSYKTAFSSYANVVSNMREWPYAD